MRPYHITSYNRLNDQTQDIEAKRIDKMIENIPFTIVNKLPVDIIVTQESGYTLPLIKPVQNLLPSLNSITLSTARDGDVLHFQYFNFNEKSLKFVCPSHIISKRTGRLYVGNVSSYTKTYKRDTHPGGDISSINVHNLLPWDIYLYKNDDHHPSILVQSNSDNLEIERYRGDLTMSPMVYYDNRNMGLHIGTKFRVYASINPKAPTKLYDFYISDIDEDHILIGDVSPQIDEHTSTGANPQIYTVMHTGAAIYRMSNPIPISFPGGITGGAQIRGKNIPGYDMHRVTIHNLDKTSTIPTARFKKLSGENVICSQYL